MLFPVDGSKEPFCAAKHHPVLSYQTNEEPPRKYYIALHYECCIYTHVEDGASSATFFPHPYGSRWSEPESTSQFQVLVLRHDPEDYRSNQMEGELKNPTGPLGWKNVHFFEEVSLADSLSWFP
ncbi:hypothetical protein SCHPADRAFT_999664 [Schizopora paradoxa]|uniref:Uncharacterized protein n=1 Tax=Schizopora paradoxa TaxID=27342 RepID=A0A0H2RLF2_9AGAM|nr:hypothetical protein SCHPADRAFT_999664 [Schizopora paradoxa]